MTTTTNGRHHVTPSSHFRFGVCKLNLWIKEKVRRRLTAVQIMPLVSF
jgi:hypothetical protein